jgi:hypothetical protein
MGTSVCAPFPPPQTVILRTFISSLILWLIVGQ